MYIIENKRIGSDIKCIIDYKNESESRYYGIELSEAVCLFSQPLRQEITTKKLYYIVLLDK